MKIWINKKEEEYTAPLSLLQLLQKIEKAEKKGIAIAVNNFVVSKKNWEKTSLEANDKITIIAATQGG